MEWQAMRSTPLSSNSKPNRLRGIETASSSGFPGKWLLYVRLAAMTKGRPLRLVRLFDAKIAIEPHGRFEKLKVLGSGRLAVVARSLNDSRMWLSTLRHRFPSGGLAWVHFTGVAVLRNRRTRAGHYGQMKPCLSLLSISVQHLGEVPENRLRRVHLYT